MIARVINGVAGLLGAAAGAQFPAFYGQYLQRLGGRLDQARIEAGRLNRLAEAAGLRLNDYVDRLLASKDATQRIAGTLHQETLTDWRTLGQAQIELSNASPFERPFAFLRHLDLDLAYAALGDFQPSLPLTLEAAIYAVLGLLIGVALSALFTPSTGLRRTGIKA